jgi:uncharacterized spore protein YtfJ
MAKGGKKARERSAEVAVSAVAPAAPAPAASAPSAPPPPFPPPTPGESLTAALPGLRQFVGRLTGARLCFGKPVRAGDRAVVPVASVRVAGGGGGGRGPTGGGGGGGQVNARPVGYIEVGPDGTRFRRIVDLGQVAALAGAGAVAAAVALRPRRRGRRRWPR